VVVTDVSAGTPAADAGLQRDDVIEEINHHPVMNVADYERIVRQAGKQEVVLLVNRGGETSFVVVEPELRGMHAHVLVHRSIRSS